MIPEMSSHLAWLLKGSTTAGEGTDMSVSLLVESTKMTLDMTFGKEFGITVRLGTWDLRRQVLDRLLMLDKSLLCLELLLARLDALELGLSSVELQVLLQVVSGGKSDGTV